MTRVFLELIRILAIILLLGALMGGVIKLIYGSFGINVDDTIGGWLVGCSILLFLFVLYRNKLQFSGFYKGENKKKLSIKVSFSLISCSILLIVLAPLFS